MLMAAVVSLSMQRTSTSSQFDGRLAFPSFESQLDSVSSFKVVSSEGTLTLHLSDSGEWVVQERNNYPADLDSVRRLALGLADLELIEPKTARADWHVHLGLDDPTGGGAGTRFQALGGEDVLADVVAGTEQGLPDLNGATFRYVRLGEDSQTYLARGQLDLGSDVGSWIDLDIFSFERERIMSVTSDAGEEIEKTFSAARATPDTYNFSLASLPDGFEPTSEGIANGVGSSLTAMTFLDVQPEEMISFAGAKSLGFETFDGLSVDVQIVRLGEDYWLKYLVSDARTEAVADEARTAMIDEFNLNSTGWAFKVPNWKGDQMTMALDDMIKRIGEVDE
jgi:hypothetical protein